MRVDHEVGHGRPLPSGTLTFLFSDIEGSTRLLQLLGDEAYGHALGRHQELMSQAFDRHDGMVIGTEGDSFMVVFQDAPKAVMAALDAQRALAAEPWPDGAAFRVRIGVHTGHAITAGTAGDDYVGLTVHQAARVMSAAHGGQVYLSEAARGLVASALPDQTSLRDLGEHRLKDLQHPERLWQLTHPDLEPGRAPNTLDARPHNLPVQPTRFVGRTADLAALCALLRRPDVRMVTITGPGGIGKTRVALQAAAEVIDGYPNGVWFVALGPLRSPDVVAQAIASATGASADQDSDVVRAIVEHLSEQRCLLVLDNFEHVRDAAPVVSRILEMCPRADICVSSREPLHVTGEHEFPLQPMRVATGDGQIADAVALFLQRALAVNPQFATDDATLRAVAEVCDRLDGLPLAIELAAARTKSLTPAALLERFTDVLDLPEGGSEDVPARQRTLRDAISWSTDLLSAEEKAAFARLAMFRGGFEAEAGEAVADCELQVLTSLVDRSLVRADAGPAGTTRYSMLETIREFALEKLRETGDLDEVRLAMTRHYTRVAIRAESESRGPKQVDWLDRLEADHENLRTALTWAMEAEPDPALELAGRLAWFWRTHTHLKEMRETLSRVLDRCPERSAGRVRALVGLASIMPPDKYQLECEAMAPLGFDAPKETVPKKGRDKKKVVKLIVAGALTPTPAGEAGGHAALLKEAAEIVAEIRDPQLEFLVVDEGLRRFKSLPEQQRPLAQRALELARDLGDDVAVAHYEYIVRGSAKFFRTAIGQLRGRRDIDDQREEMARSRGDMGALLGILRDRSSSGKAPQREADAREAIALAQRLGDRKAEVEATLHLVATLSTRSRISEVEQLAEQLLAIVEEIGDDALVRRVLMELGYVAISNDDPQKVREYLQRLRTITRRSGESYLLRGAQILMGLGGLGTIAGGLAWTMASSTASGRTMGVVLALAGLRFTGSTRHFLSETARQTEIRRKNLSVSVSMLLVALSGLVGGPAVAAIGAVAILAGLISKALKSGSFLVTSTVAALGATVLLVVARGAGAPASIVDLAAPVAVLVMSAILSVVGRGLDGRWALASVGGIFGRIWAPLFFVSLVGGQEWEPWLTIAMPALVAGCVLFSAGLAIGHLLFVPAAVAIGYSSPILFSGFADGRFPRTASIVFGLGWIALGVARRIRRARRIRARSRRSA